MVADDVCRGCYMELNGGSLPTEIAPIWRSKDLVIRQDAEVPMPAFYILSTRTHYGRMIDLPFSMAQEIGAMLILLRRKMSEVLGIDRCHCIVEEKLVNPHFHVWLMPLWPAAYLQMRTDPKVWEENIHEYMNMFKFRDSRENILKCNELMRTQMSLPPSRISGLRNA